MRQFGSMRHLLVMISFMTACGKDPGAKGASDQAGSQQETATATPTPDTLYVDTLADLGPCDAHNQRQLIYAAEDAQFHTCSANSWQVVVIKGKDGKDGLAGTTGTAGTNGKDGQDKTIPNLWKDPMTTRTWVFGSLVGYASASCPAGWTMPTRAESDVAWNHGIGIAVHNLGLSSGFWIIPESPTQSRQAYNTLAADYMASFFQTITACYRDGV